MSDSINPYSYYGKSTIKQAMIIDYVSSNLKQRERSESSLSSSVPPAIDENNNLSNQTLIDNRLPSSNQLRKHSLVSKHKFIPTEQSKFSRPPVVQYGRKLMQYSQTYKK